VKINRVGPDESLGKALDNGVFHKNNNKLYYALDEAGYKLANPARTIHQSRTLKYLRASCHI
jgi:hypothetical protein